MNKSPCPCGLSRSFAECCEPYLSGDKLPKTAEALMRSRYTAYTRADIDYIQATQRPPASINFNPTEASQWANEVEWLSLKVLQRSKVVDNKATVEFKAYFLVEGSERCLHEKSLFEAIHGRWYYVSGEHA